MSGSKKTWIDERMEESFRLEKYRNRLNEAANIIKGLRSIIEQDQTNIYRAKLKLTPPEVLLLEKSKKFNANNQPKDYGI